MKNISIVSIPVTDQERAKSFYLKIGFSLIVETALENGQKWIQLRFPNTETSITLVNWFESMPAGCIRGLVVESENIEQEVEQLRARGIETGDIEKMPWGRFASVKDPDGNTLSLHQR